MFDCTASIVTYKNPPDMIRNTIKSLLSCSLNSVIHVVDNSPTEVLKSSLEDLPVQYHFCGSNSGYGRGHNRALRECFESKYHIITNPDITLAPSTIETLYRYMKDNPDIGIVSPKVLNEDGSVQYLNKRYPTVFDMFSRRFIPKSLHSLIKYRLNRYEMKDVGYEDICDVECISGCFMFCRTEILRAVDGFDDRYFMYFEDFDLSRKIQQIGCRTVYYPLVTVTHLWERASHKNIKMTFVFIANMSRYFNKWGWKWF
jgi:GT2 family glycosyltransferase